MTCTRVGGCLKKTQGPDAECCCDIDAKIREGLKKGIKALERSMENALHEGGGNPKRVLTLFLAGALKSNLKPIFDTLFYLYDNVTVETKENL